MQFAEIISSPVNFDTFLIKTCELCMIMTRILQDLEMYMQFASDNHLRNQTLTCVKWAPGLFVIQSSSSLCAQYSSSIQLECNVNSVLRIRSYNTTFVCKCLDSPVRRDVAEGCCCCEGTPEVRKGRGRKARKGTGTGRRCGGRMGTG